MLLAAFLALAPLTARGAAASVLEDIDEDDREAVEALALYPEDVRDNALRAATEPGVLERLQALQDDSQDEFRELLDPYSQDDQEQLFELSRYPDLIDDIARGGKKSRSELATIAARYPEDVREAAVRQGSERHHVVSRMSALLEDFDQRFDGLVEDLSPSDRDAFRALLRTPELLSLLSEHMNMTVVLGKAYEDDPAEARGALSDLNLEVARRNAEEADDWKRSVDSDPDLRRDYEAASADYQRDTGYSAYQGPRTVVNVSFNPYPYWFGYPWWYPVSYTYYDPWYWWYPRRSWGHCGYSYGPRVAFYGGPIWRPWYPTYHFSSWYFSHGHHHARYPYFSDHFVSYYQRPVVVKNVYNYNYYNLRGRSVKKFVHHADRVMPARFMAGKNRKERVERFREYGKLAPEIERVERDARRKEFARERGKRPGKDFRIGQGEDRGEDAARSEVQKIVAKNPKQYPELSKVDKKSWERRDRGKDAEDAQGAARDRGKRGDETGVGGEAGKGGKDRALEGPKGSGDRDRGDKARPAPGGGDRDDRQRDRAKGKEKEGGAASPGPDTGTVQREREKSKKARPTFDRPGDTDRDRDRGSAKSGRGKGDEKGAASPDRSSGDEARAKRSGGDGGGKRNGGGGSSDKRAAQPERSAPSFDAPDARKDRSVKKSEPKQRETPRYDAPPKERSGGGGGGQGYQRREEPRVQQQAPRQEPRMERSGGGDRPKSGGGGGGGGGGKNNKKDKAEEEGNGGGGGGGGGGGKRGR